MCFSIFLRKKGEIPTWRFLSVPGKWGLGNHGTCLCTPGSQAPGALFLPDWELAGPLDSVDLCHAEGWAWEAHPGEPAWLPRDAVRLRTLYLAGASASRPDTASTTPRRPQGHPKQCEWLLADLGAAVWPGAWVKAPRGLFLGWQWKGVSWVSSQPQAVLEEPFGNPRPLRGTPTDATVSTDEVSGVCLPQALPPSCCAQAGSLYQ